MNMVDVNGQLANIAQIARKCPTATLRRAFVRALRELCQQSQWLTTSVVGPILQNVPQYTLGNDPDLDIIGIKAMSLTVLIGGQPQTFPVTPANAQFFDPNYAPSQPQCYQYLPEAQFQLFPVPQQDYTATIQIIVQPKEDAVNVPKAPLLKYSNEVEAGALEYLLGLPGQAWSNPQMAMIYGKKFAAGIANAKTEVQRGYNTGSIRATPRRFVV